MSNVSPLSDKSDDRSIRTRQNLLNAAEHVFAERGYKGASMRMITKLAKANIAAANYHFGGKEGLFDAITKRYFDNIGLKRSRLALEAEKAGTMEAYLRIVICPFFEFYKEDPTSARYIARIISRMPYEVPEIVFPLLKKYLIVTIKETEHKLRKLLSDVSDYDFSWFLHTLHGLLTATISRYGAVMIRDLNLPYYREIDPDEAVQRLIQTSMTHLRSIGYTGV